MGEGLGAAFNDDVAGAGPATDDEDGGAGLAGGVRPALQVDARLAVAEEVERADADRGAGFDVGVPGDGHVDLAGAHRDAEGGPARRELEPGQVEFEEAGGMAVRRLEIGHHERGDRPAARLPVDPGEGAGQGGRHDEEAHRPDDHRRPPGAEQGVSEGAEGGEAGGDREHRQMDVERPGGPEQPAHDRRSQEPQADEPADGPHEEERAVRHRGPRRGRGPGAELGRGGGRRRSRSGVPAGGGLRRRTRPGKRGRCPRAGRPRAGRAGASRAGASRAGAGRAGAGRAGAGRAGSRRAGEPLPAPGAGPRAGVGGRRPGEVAAEEQEQAADEEQEAEEGLAGDEAPVRHPEDADGEQAEADEGRRDDAEDGADHAEHSEGRHDRQSNPQVPAGPLRGGEEVAAPVRVLLRNHHPGDEVGQDAPSGQAAEDDGEPDERRVELRRRRQPSGDTAELPVVPGPQDLKWRRPDAAAGLGRRSVVAGVGRRSAVRGGLRVGVEPQVTAEVLGQLPAMHGRYLGLLHRQDQAPTFLLWLEKGHATPKRHAPVPVPAPENPPNSRFSATGCDPKDTPSPSVSGILRRSSGKLRGAARRRKCLRPRRSA